MSNNSTTLFSGQVIYIGMDVHKRSWTVTELYGGNVTRTNSITPSLKRLAERLHREYPGAEFKSVYEAGFCGFHLHRKLEEIGIHNIVINPADVPTSWKERNGKNDAVDSRKLARELANNTLIPIYIPSEENLRLRNLVRRETQVVRNRTRCMNRIKAHLTLNGMTLKSWSGGNLRQQRAEALNHGDITLCLLIDELLMQRQQHLETLRQERLCVRSLGLEELLKRLDSVPGIGFRTALMLLAEIWDMKRFHTGDQLTSFVGLSPRLYGSGDSERMTGTGTRKHAALQSLLIEAAWRAIGIDVELRAKYCSLSAKKKPQVAIFAVARKLLMRIRAVWLLEKNYNLNRVEK